MDIFQSTLPQGERLFSTSGSFSVMDISIHAPARGATFFVINCHRKINNFNPRSRKGSDIHIINIILNFFNFNPRSRKGSDVICAKRKIVHKKISIHAPARGATGFPNVRKATTKDFNPRSRKGSDAIYE